jgi:predicted TIM-barrel fold metal-dependent hydrolase
VWNGTLVIDADAHMHEPRDLWENYVEAKFRSQAPKVAFMDGVFMIYEPDGTIIPKKAFQNAPPASAAAVMEEKYGDAYRQWWSPAIRLRDMDRFGWDIQVLLPTGNNGNFAYRVAAKHREIGAALCRAYNNWCHDYCSADPKRLKFVAVLPGGNVDDMILEARRAVDVLGAVSVRNPWLPEGKWLHEPEYDALWNLATELDFPISVHGEYRAERFAPFHAVMGSAQNDLELSLHGIHHAIGFPCDNMTTLAHFIFTGILERFPQLRLAILESNSGWLPFWLGRMDDHTHGRNAVMGASTLLERTPTEYFLRQCSIACDGDERALEHVVDYLQGDHIVWNTDYPHPDAMEPATALPTFLGRAISEAAKKKILCDNAVKLFGPRLLSGDLQRKGTAR